MRLRTVRFFHQYPSAEEGCLPAVCSIFLYQSDLHKLVFERKKNAFYYPNLVKTHTLYLSAAKIIGGQKTSLLASVQPLSTALLGIFWLNISFSPLDWLGSLLIVSTIVLLSLKKMQYNLYRIFF
ncbi:MAG TPA: hypothetical protein DD740_11760 [Chryseobacterium sp.]|nr:hypothetical protein [Chryseobacterium sp.]